MLLVVYADILIILNIIVDYFLILASASLLHIKPKLYRIIFASVIGGISSLYIFAPDLGFFMGIIYRIVICLLMSLTAFGFRGIKQYLRASGILMLVTCGYGGIMTAVYTLLKPNGMAVGNSVVYFNISPAVLIGASVASYILFSIISSIFARTSKLAERCKITITAEDESITIDGIIDTGNSINDIFGNSEVIIADSKYIESLLGGTDPNKNEKLKSRYRIMPCSTVSGNGTLEGFRCDTATVSDGEKEIKLYKPILAVSKTHLNEDYGAIVNPKIFM